MAFVTTNFAFPFCQVPDRALLPVAEVPGPTDDGYPVEVSYDKMFEWYWRIKEISIAFAASFVIEVGTWTGTCVMSGTWTSTGTEPDERELVCGLNKSWSGTVFQTNAMHWVDSGGIPDYYEDGSVGFEVQILLPYIGSATLPRWKQTNGGSYLPAFYFGGFVRSASSLGFDVVSQDLGGGVSFPGAVNFDGTIPRMWYYVEDPFLTSSSFSAIANIEEYYGYDPGDGGGDVWNTSTGSQERNPFSI